MEDDEFGDLYADVEVQASSAINGVPGHPQLCFENDDVDIVEETKGSDLNRVDFIHDDADEAENRENLENGSESEDDFNIVLNKDDDGLEFPVTRGVSLRNGGVEDEDREEGEEEEERENGGLSDKNRMVVDSLKGGDGLEQSSNGGNRRIGGKSYYNSQYKYMRLHPSAFPSTSKGNRCEGPGSYSSPSVRGDQEDNWCYQRMRSSLVGAQSVHQFSLPRSRTILDVNIDTFDEKPWRHPGANMTDFFNFGFEEDSWKHYCNRLDQYRHGDIEPTRILNSDSSTHNGFYDAGTERENVSQSATAVKIQRRRERTISLTSKVPRTEQNHSEMKKGRAIQVAGSISERKSSMDIRRPLDRDSDVVIQINVQDSKEDSSGSVKEEVGHIDSSEQGAYENGDFSIDNDIDGLSFSSFSEDEVPRESLDSHDEGLDTPASKRCSLQKQPHEEVALYDSDGPAKTLETSKNTKKEVGRSTCNTSPTILGEGSSHDEWNQCSLSSSYSGSDCEAFNGTYIDAEKSYNYVKKSSPNSLTELQKSLTSDYYHSKDFRSQDIKLKHGYCKYSARCRSPVQEDSEHHSRSLFGMPGSKKHLNDEEPIPISETERLYDVYHSAHDHSRQEEKLDAFNYNHGDDFSYYKKAAISSNYYGEKFPDYQIEAACTKYPRRKGQQRFKVATDRFVRKNSDEREYLLDDEMMARDWDHYESRLAVDSMHPPTCQESRQLNLNYLQNERDARWKRIEGELKFRNGMRNNTDFPLEQKHTYGPPQQKYKRSGPYNVRGRNNFIHKYEGHLPYTRRETKSPERSRRKYMDNEDDFWTSRDHRSFSSHSFREAHTADSIRCHGTMSPRNDIYERNGRRGRYKRQIWTERSRDSDVDGGYTEAFEMGGNVNDPDDRVYSGRRRHHWKSQLLHWTEDENIFRHRNYEFHAETTFSSKRTSWHKRFDADHRIDHVGNLIDDMQVDQLNNKLISEGDRGNQCKRSSNISHNGNHERTFLRCGDSVDSYLDYGEGKSLGRFSAAGSVMYNGRHDNMDLNFVDVEQSMFMEFNGTRINMVEQHENPEVEISQNDKKWLDPPQNKSLDIEEGQILTDEINEDAIENNICVSNNVPQISDVKGLHNENATNKSMTDDGYKNPRILEVIAKMEKRRERFKEPITLKDKISKPLVNSFDETSGTKQQRPARKRRWGGH